MTSKRDLITYLHQCLFSPPKRTLLKAIHNNQLVTWPGLTTKAVSKYLDDDSPATDKGHMKRLRQGIRSTKVKDPNITYITELAALSADMNPPKTTEEFNHLFCYTGQVNNKDGTIYVDLTGNFPIRSLAGHTSIFVVYDWTTNAILVRAMKGASDNEMIKAFKDVITYLTNRGYKPKINILDNVASKTIKTYLQKEKIQLQLVEPHNHRVNAAERAMQTFKNHLISGLCTTDKDFPA